jgi:hypothetical protein
MKKALLFFIFLNVILFSKAQINPLGKDNTFIALDRENGFFILSSFALASYFLVKKNQNNSKIDYYQTHIGYFENSKYRVLMQNFGVERNYSHWFSLKMEVNLQEIINQNNFYTMGLGYKLYSRWSLFGKKKISPFFEYGSGVSFALKKFPENGTSFTFNLTYAIGLEVKLKNKNKLRIDANFLHHSNAGLSDNNPGFDGNGISLTYSWLLK